MYQSRNDLSETTRTKVIELLGPRLAEAIDLELQARQAHWNVKGVSFKPLFELFNAVAESVEQHIERIAERIVQLGGVAEGTVQSAAKRTSLKPYPLTAADGLEHVDAVASVLAAFGKEIRRAIDVADELGDRDTADLLTQISRGLDEQLWFVEAHGQGAARSGEKTPRRKLVA